LPGKGNRAGRACSLTRSLRPPTERPGLRGSAARRLPRTPSAACQRAPAGARPLASCGPGRGSLDRPTLAAGQAQTPDESRAYAVQASAGRSNDSRSYSDDCADKTDLHAYERLPLLPGLRCLVPEAGSAPSAAGLTCGWQPTGELSQAAFESLHEVESEGRLAFGSQQVGLVRGCSGWSMPSASYSCW
jgi:hypothetical protein